MSRTVTVGIDGSRESLAAANWAAEEALRRGIPLKLLHVWSKDEERRTRWVDPATARGWGERTLRITERRLRRRHSGLSVVTAWVPGYPVDALCAAGDASELLVLGSRGLGGLAGFLAGSVSLAVLARLQRPAVLVRAHNVPAPGKPRSAGDVVLGLDVYSPSDEMIEFAFTAAERYGCRLHVLHSWQMPAVYGPDMAGVLPTLLADIGQERQRALDDALAPWTEKYPAVPVFRQCNQGRAAQDLAEASRDARLVVVGRRNRRARIGTHIGAVTHGVLHHCVAPVAVVPHD
ncbi:universal stress protein [Streptomyces lunaelactis]|uniref:universal stress protein n=1 Tax=Streptomyces lunaelactis TaxID=1535768 RepID=UPI001585C45E|nr:universal stress protein [Streptomyces lunaelactis]NUK83597.1 universal stress protein [Streptomyces lunaelactis]